LNSAEFRFSDSAEHKMFTAENVVLADVLLHFCKVSQQLKLLSYFSSICVYRKIYLLYIDGQ